MQIEGSVALVTGGNRGLGKAFVQAFLAAGARKIYVGVRHPIEIDDPHLQAVQLDITNLSDVTAAAEACQDVNILINNAGVASMGSFLTAPSLEAARAEIETNYLGTLAMCQVFAPILKRNGGGALLNMLSVVSWFTNPLMGSYSASKAAEWSLTNGVRMELRSQGTLVIGVHAGFIDTEMADQIADPKVRPEEVAVAVIEAILAGHEEVLADQRSKDIKAALVADPQSLNQLMQARWDQRK